MFLTDKIIVSQCATQYHVISAVLSPWVILVQFCASEGQMSHDEPWWISWVVDIIGTLAPPFQHCEESRRGCWVTLRSSLEKTPDGGTRRSDENLSRRYSHYSLILTDMWGLRGRFKTCSKRCFWSWHVLAVVWTPPGARHSAQEGLPFLRSSWIWQDVATGTARLCWRFLLVYVSQYIDVVSNYSKFGSKCLSCQAHTGNRWPFQAQPVPEPRDFSKVRETMLPHKNGWFHIHFHTKNGQFCASIDSPFLIPKSIARGHLHLTHPNLTDESLRAAVNQAPRHSSLEQRLLEYVNDLLYHAVSVSWFIDILRRYAVDTVCTICIGLLWKWAGWFSCGIYLLVN